MSKWRSKAAQQANACARKRRYPSMQEANVAAVDQEERYGYMVAYGCIWCGGFHIGHPIRYGATDQQRGNGKQPLDADGST